MSSFREEILSEITRVNTHINEGKDLSSNDLKTLFLIALLEEEGRNESK